MTQDDTTQDTDATREGQGLPEEGPGSKTTPPSNPEPETDEAAKGQEKLDRIVPG